MPFLHLHTVQGLLSPTQKTELMERFTQALIDTEGGGDPAFRQFVTLCITEQPAEHWQLGSLRPTAAQIQALVAKREGA